MEYCHHAGIPHSEFLSWDERDQEAEIEYMLYDKSRCPGCGTFPEEWFGEDNRHLQPPPYLPTTINCLGCETLADTRDQIPDKQQSHIHVYLQPNEEAHRGRYRQGRRTGSSLR
jgi:hypothetical protein